MQTKIITISSLIILGVVVFFTQLNAANEYIYLARWNWFCNEYSLCYWKAPGVNNVSLIDLRTVPQMSQKNVKGGYGIFVYNTPQSIPDSIELGTSFNRQLSVSDKQKISNALGKNINSNTISDLLWDLLTVMSDPTGETAPKPLTSKYGKDVEMHIGSLTRKEPFSGEHIKRAIAVFKNDYKLEKNKNQPYVMEKWLGQKMLEIYGTSTDELSKTLLPPEFSNDKWRKPETTINESWNCSNADSITCDLTWTETLNDIDIISNQASAQTGFQVNEARAGTSLSSTDHYAQASTRYTSVGYPGTTVRVSTSTRTYYFGRITTNDDNHIFKTIAGTATALDSSTAGQTVNVYYTIYTEINGSSLTVKLNGSAIGGSPITDTSITAGLNTGISTWHNTSEWDNFVASDLAAPPATIIISPIIFFE